MSKICFINLSGHDPWSIEKVIKKFFQLVVGKFLGNVWIMREWNDGEGG